MSFFEIVVGVGCAVMSICLFVYLVKRMDFRDDDGGKYVEV